MLFYRVARTYLHCSVGMEVSLFSWVCMFDAGHSDSWQVVQGVVLMAGPVLSLEGCGVAFNVPCLFLVSTLRRLPFEQGF